MSIVDKQTLADLNVTNSRYKDMVDFFRLYSYARWAGYVV
ncbi:Uncharacterised protein [Sphingobacterium multivorum]|uniref:Uncharacterized protein n=1 Tax=Sphingobacterium multivorum TaxID=28454 RepID=A0A2X2JFX4_SPHMU|nr:Uncharacterised protein [Sphingobacterium multivorum]